jgi:hypothetical protein
MGLALLAIATTETISDDLGFRTSGRPMTEIPLTLLTGLVVAGGCVYIRTRRAAPLLRTPVAAEAER